MSPRSRVLLAASLFGPLAAAGCFGIYTAEVPDQYLTGGWSRTDSGGGERWLGLAAEWVHVTYEVDPPRGTFGDGPYPASLTIMSIDTVQRLTREEVSERLDAQVRENAEQQGIQIQASSKATGERDLASSARSLYFTYLADVGGGSSLFDAGRQARVLGEVWFDEEEGITVLAVGLAQVQGGNTAATRFVDETNWARLVADPRGSIQGHTADDGLVFNVRSHP